MRLTFHLGKFTVQVIFMQILITETRAKNRHSAK